MRLNSVIFSIGPVVAASLPVVDLGYAVYQAANLNQADYYTFPNLRYAAPPTDDLRWRAPQAPAANRTVIQTSRDNDVVCPQSAPAWYKISDSFLKSYLGSDAIIGLDPGPLLLDPSQPTPEIDSRTNEDCLFLDVYTPKSLLDQKEKAQVPVLVWIHGGGYTAGSKTDFTFSPEGLYNVSDGNFVVVSINYRLGSFGFLGGPRVVESGVANAGLLDQRFALEWVKKHISRFGGDPSKVTIMGESAGGGSVMLQITAYGGSHGAPFQQAIPQSAAYIPNVTPSFADRSFESFLGYLNVSTLDEARKVSAEALIRANLLLVGNSSPLPSYPVGPVVDEDFIPAPVTDLLSSGRYTHGLRVLTGHNSDEGLMFTNPNATDDASFSQWVQNMFTPVSETTLEKVLSLYPSTFDGSLPYTSAIQRAALFTSDFAFNSFANVLASASGHKASFAYIFSIYPALHGQDLFYTFYTPENPAAPLVANVTIAKALQKGIASFVETGTPDFGSGNVEEYGKQGRILNLSSEAVSSSVDPALNNRTQWFIDGGYSALNGGE